MCAPAPLPPSGIPTDADFRGATSVFVLAYAAIVPEKVHKTTVALCGAALVLLLRIVQPREAFHFEELGVDWSVVFLLIGMMVIINVIRPTGLFEHIATRAARAGRGDRLRTLLPFALITAVLSAFLDNVTTVLLIAPVTLLAAEALRVDPVPYLVVEALASSIGGNGTAIGAPANVIVVGIAEKAGHPVSFRRFLACGVPTTLLTVAIAALYVRVRCHLLWAAPACRLPRVRRPRAPVGPAPRQRPEGPARRRGRALPALPVL